MSACVHAGVLVVPDMSYSTGSCVSAATGSLFRVNGSLVFASLVCPSAGVEGGLGACAHLDGAFLCEEVGAVGELRHVAVEQRTEPHARLQVFALAVEMARLLHWNNVVSPILFVAPSAELP